MDDQAIYEDQLGHMLSGETKEPMRLPFSFLQTITNNFSPESTIGHGGFAHVYKGVLQNGMAVAVKKLSKPHLLPDNKLFLREIKCLKKAKHINVVRYLGYCCNSQGQICNYEGEDIIAEELERLICFEYVPKGDLRGYIKDASCGLEWRDRYKIIRGICEGLHHLHGNNILHLDLKPANILMDEKMKPKIADFGLSRCLEKENTDISTTEAAGTRIYMAPESAIGCESTQKSDIYSLGIIIMEILTGDEGYHDINVDEVLQKWSNRLEESRREQVRVCTDIAIECTKINPDERPINAQRIIDKLDKTESTYAEERLDIHLVELRFPVEPNTDEHMVFRLMNKSSKSWQCFASIPLYGIMPSKSNYSLVVTAKRHKRLTEETDYDLILQSSILNDRNIRAFQDQSEYDQFFEEAHKSGKAVHEHAASRGIKNQQIISVKNTHGVLCCLDAQTTEPWIVTGHQHGDVCLWNYYPQRGMDSFNIWKESAMHSYSSSNKVHSVKVISRKEKTWFVSATSDGVIHAYDYNNKMKEVSSFRAASDSFITSMAVHPTSSYLLSSAHRAVKLWDWDNGWKECEPSFNQEHYASIRQVAFNPKNTNIFATASDDHTIKVWSIGSPESKYTLSGHQGKVNCLDFFRCDGTQYLITGSDDRTAKIWNMEKAASVDTIMEACVHTMEAFMSPVNSVLALGDPLYLIAGSKDGSVHIFSVEKGVSVHILSSTNFRLERIVNFGSSGAIWGLGNLMGSSKRIVIGQEYAISIMDMEMCKH